MKKGLIKFQVFAAILIFSFLSLQAHAQVLEWRLVNPVYSTVDPDGSGPATGSVSFTLQIHTVSAPVNNINTISMGWSFQSAKAMIPTIPGCSIVNSPANVAVSSLFTNAGFTFTTVNQCGVFTQIAGGQTFDRRTVGTLDGTSINLTTTWVDVFTITLWALTNVAPQAGYAIINSGAGGTPAPFPTYAVADVTANEYVVNSQTFANPLPLGSGVIPVTLAKFESICNANGALLKWQTLTEENSDRYEIEKSENGVGNWKYAGSVKAAGSSVTLRQYEFADVQSNNTTWFYRLRQIDKDGKFVFSPIIKTSCNSNSDLLVYPIPAKTLLYINLTVKKNSRATIKVLDVSGKVYQLLEKDLLKGLNRLSLNVSKLAAGQYVLRVEEGGNTQFKPVLIQ